MGTKPLTLSSAATGETRARGVCQWAEPQGADKAMSWVALDKEEHHIAGPTGADTCACKV